MVDPQHAVNGTHSRYRGDEDHYRQHNERVKLRYPEQDAECHNERIADGNVKEAQVVLEVLFHIDIFPQNTVAAPGRLMT